jgi:hypothetical protein
MKMNVFLNGILVMGLLMCTKSMDIEHMLDFARALIWQTLVTNQVMG